ncbi:conserved hypothetical protein [Uncinocarpus reesii 1704]|uniref:FAS1 domain-containing protein n=1 Tax=Uncinocarpus reesii (strain UAMH 1704) TaxID=336963 RepID=C4JIW1_UNCRE|nr:uncharacterized protein UREG_01568 [Uncinocarpus reesii 1704]EEP76719.1 conserved hypothetical protein [Uncinocarpus reesii 1704]
MGEQGGDQRPLIHSHERLAISDILSKTREINIFASLTREFEYLSDRFEDKTQSLIVLAPTNTAIEGLPHKPWESTSDYVDFGSNEAYAGRKGEERAANNLRRFVEAHVISSDSWAAGDNAQTLAGQEVRWEKDKNGKIRVYPGNIEVERIAARISNGEVWILNGIIEFV